MQPKSISEEFDDQQKYMKHMHSTVTRLVCFLAISICLNIALVVYVCIHANR